MLNIFYENRKNYDSFSKTGLFARNRFFVIDGSSSRTDMEIKFPFYTSLPPLHTHTLPTFRPYDERVGLGIFISYFSPLMNENPTEFVSKCPVCGI